MSLEVSPVGTVCNIECTYCYEPLMGARKAGRYDEVEVHGRLKELLKTHGSFSVFGGEPLLTPIGRLEKLFQINPKQNGVQTNGIAITEAHIRLFKEYNVHVGISIDGPGECNSPRCDKNATDTTNRNIGLLIENKIIPSLIITLHKANDRSEFIDWLIWFDKAGIKYARLHLMQVGTKAAKDLRCHDAVMLDRLKKLEELETTFKNLKFDFFREMRQNLKGLLNQSSCIWKGCDPYHTSAVITVNPNGTVSGCPRINVGVKNEHYNPIRSELLLKTECKGCKYFLICQGGCPATSSDWRHKTDDCFVIYNMYEYLEKQLNRVGIETVGKNPGVLVAQSRACNNSHGDVPHGDSHGDHTDVEHVLEVS